MRVNETDSQGNTFYRCPHCGDSRKDPSTAHYAVNTSKGVAYCYRCQASDRLPPGLLLSSTEWREAKRREDGSIDLSDFKNHCPGRLSLLPRLKSESWEDVFPVRTATGALLGTYTRRANGSSRLTASGLGFPGLWALSSSETDPLTVVEGPYDVTEPGDVCVYGMITDGRLSSHLRGQYLVLCPDADVWDRPDWGRTMARMLRSADYMVLGAQRLSGTQDPDEVPSIRRTALTRADLMKGDHKKPWQL